jgi:hypothetical protein
LWDGGKIRLLITDPDFCESQKSNKQKKKKEGVGLNIQSIKQEWFGNVRGDVLAGLVVALALIPEAIAFCWC